MIEISKGIERLKVTEISKWIERIQEIET